MDYKAFINQLHAYNYVFDLFFTPGEDIMHDPKKQQRCFDLMKKSCEEKHDYVSEEYKIDVEHRRKHYDVIYD